MALLNVLQYPDPRLRLKSLPVTEVNDAIRKIVDDMFETRQEQDAAGLAAPQLNIQQRIIVIDYPPFTTQPLCLINPEITHREGVQYDYEGCMSFQGVFDKVERAAKIHFHALDRDGQRYEMDAEGQFAVCVQHELDHLDGVLFIDHLSKLRQERMRTKLKKIRRRTY